MVKVCRIHPSVKGYFTANALAGWPDGVLYDLIKRRRKVKKEQVGDYIEPPPVERLDGHGFSILNK